MSTSDDPEATTREMTAEYRHIHTKARKSARHILYGSVLLLAGTRFTWTGWNDVRYRGGKYTVFLGGDPRWGIRSAVWVRSFVALAQ